MTLATTADQMYACPESKSRSGGCETVVELRVERMNLLPLEDIKTNLSTPASGLLATVAVCQAVAWPAAGSGLLGFATFMYR